MAVPSSPRRRWFHYRLRTLLILMALIAAPLAWVASGRRQSRYELQLADELQRRDFILVTTGGPYDEMERMAAGIPQGWWRDLARSALGERVLAIQVAQREFDDATPLARLTSLRRLDLSSTQVESVDALAGLKQLTYLSLRSTQVQDLKPLAGLKKLQWLDAGFTPVANVTPLAKLSRLESLSLDSTKVTDVTPLASLLKLQTLNLRATQLTEISALAYIPELKTLELNLSKVSSGQVDALQSTLPNCVISHSQ